MFRSMLHVTYRKANWSREVKQDTTVLAASLPAARQTIVLQAIRHLLLTVTRVTVERHLV